MGSPSQSQRLAVAAMVCLAAPVVALLAVPLLAGAAIVDLVTGTSTLRRARLVAFGLNVLLLEVVGIFAAAALWVGAGFGARLARPTSITAHYRVQRWWARAVFDAARRWLGLHVVLEGVNELSEAEVGEAAGPVTIAARHVSFFDALLPTVLLAARPRHVLKADLAWDPCLGIFGHRLPNHFVVRDHPVGRGQLHAIERLAANAGDAPIVIFPEGTLFRPARARRARARLERDEPERAARLDLNHVLPVRPGGVLALLNGRRSDVVVLGHRGFEGFDTIRSTIANVPFVEPVTVTMWRVPADAFPAGAAARLAVIDAAWQELDDWVGAQRAQPDRRPEVAR